MIRLRPLDVFAATQKYRVSRASKERAKTGRQSVIIQAVFVVAEEEEDIDMM